MYCHLCGGALPDGTAGLPTGVATPDGLACPDCADDYDDARPSP